MTLPPLPDLPKPAYLRRLQRPDGGYSMVPAYTPGEMRDYARAAIAAHVPEAAFGNIAAVPASLTDERLIEMADDAQSAYWGQWFSDEDALIRFARAVLAAAPQAVPVPAGWVLVPVEPTIAMLCDAVKAWEGPAVYKVMSAAGLATLEEQAADAYRAMLAAAPKEQPHE